MGLLHFLVLFMILTVLFQVTFTFIYCILAENNVDKTKR